ncbi:hypothetical protein [Thermomonospora cellulosilytica]|uniref:Uncharacterized protein n=1 Tax=Thermomonospora cellulosilytica TaxID=1411118 RepID=A0A7W3N1U2_9ACTN|nr:hypothetical protein [Thermomonospora cellulosilytica]MBA9005979.1 hypothetical protein [Thermomonospora cellulosilytica]
MDDHERRHLVAEDQLLIAYGVIMRVLAALPLPIKIPSAANIHGDHVHHSLLRAYDLIGDIPMKDSTREVIREMVLDWVIAEEIVEDDGKYPARWKLDLADTQHARILAAADQAKVELELPSEE